MTHSQLWSRPEYFMPPATHSGIEYPYKVSATRFVVRKYRLATS